MDLVVAMEDNSGKRARFRARGIAACRLIGLRYCYKKYVLLMKNLQYRQMEQIDSLD
jgi:hypothetical protein